MCMVWLSANFLSGSWVFRGHLTSILSIVSIFNGKRCCKRFSYVQYSILLFCAGSSPSLVSTSTFIAHHYSYEQCSQRNLFKTLVTVVFRLLFMLLFHIIKAFCHILKRLFGTSDVIFLDPIITEDFAGHRFLLSVIRFVCYACYQIIYSWHLIFIFLFSVFRAVSISLPQQIS